ncbi:MAG: helix-turn-helix domain-containing protein [Nitrospira sp.]|nr:MAG: helix-turn-helix domain-containing protein [Nitrospira sp.]
MAAAVDRGPRKGRERTFRNSRKLDRDAALAMAKGGMRSPEIADRLGVAPSTVFRFLQSTDEENRAVQQYKSCRADVFAKIQGQALDLQQRIIQSFTDGVLSSLAPHQKTGLLHTLNTVTGTLYDKERLERGQSTTNLAVMGRIMGQAHGSLWSDRVTPQESSVQPVEALPPPTPGGGTSEAEQAEGAPDRVPSAEKGPLGGPSARPVGNRSRAAKTANKKRKAT